MLPSTVVRLLESGDWGSIDIGTSTDVLDWLRRDSALKWLDAQFAIRAKTIWSQVPITHLDERSSGHKFCLKHCTTPDIRYQSYLKHDIPRVASLRARLRLQRAHTNQYRCKFQLPDPTMVGETCVHPTCRSSFVMETVEHVLLHCPRYLSARRAVVQSMQSIHSPFLPLLPLTVPLLLGVFPVLLDTALFPLILSVSAAFLSSIRSLRFL